LAFLACVVFGVASSASAAVVFQQRDTISVGSLDACNFVFVNFTGQEMILAEQTTDATGGTHFTGHSVWSDMKGWDAAGNMYVFPNVSLTLNMDLSSGVTVGTSDSSAVTNFHIISTGQAPSLNVLFHETFVLVRDANGQYHFQDHFTFECVG
jgi:hypothetical protein